MRVLHTADWHIGRTFHGHTTLDAIAQVLAGIPQAVREHQVDVVIAAGDIFDSAAPSGAAFELLQQTLLQIRDAGAEIILISGNHDSAARLGFAGPFAKLAGIHIVTDPGQIATPLTLSDDYGAVDFFCIPYLEPALIRHRWPDQRLRNQADALSFAMARIKLARRPEARTVVVAHTFVAGAERESTDSERPIATVGSVDVVPTATFEGADYVALGHIHRPAQPAANVRYSGALLHYSFSEASSPRGGWLVELDANGVAGTEWVDLPVPRPLVTLTGELEQLLTSDEYAGYREYWVSAILTDTIRPSDAMRRLQQRFPWCAHLEHRPGVAGPVSDETYADRVQGRSDPEIVEAFLTHVRDGHGASEQERELLDEVISEHAAAEIVR